MSAGSRASLLTGYDGLVTDRLRLDPGEVRHIGREPRIPVTGYDGLVTHTLRLNPTELVVELLKHVQRRTSSLRAQRRPPGLKGNWRRRAA